MYIVFFRSNLTLRRRCRSHALAQAERPVSHALQAMLIVSVPHVFLAKSALLAAARSNSCSYEPRTMRSPSKKQGAMNVVLSLLVRPCVQTFQMSLGPGRYAVNISAKLVHMDMRVSSLPNTLDPSYLCAEGLLVPHRKPLRFKGVSSISLHRNPRA